MLTNFKYHLILPISLQTKQLLIHIRFVYYTCNAKYTYFSLVLVCMHTVKNANRFPWFPWNFSCLILENTIAGSGKFCVLPKKDFFFIKPGKVFRALQGYFLTMLGKGISSKRRGPGNLGEDSGLGNSNRPASPYPPARRNRKHQSPFYAGVAAKKICAVHRIKWFAWCQNLPIMFWMWLWTSSVLKWHLYGWFRNSLYFPADGVLQNWTRMGPPQIFGRKIKWQKRKKPCTHLEKSSTSSAEKCSHRHWQPVKIYLCYYVN